MPNFINLAGERFGRWKVIERVQHVAKRTHWRCVCDCGNFGIVDRNSLRSGSSTSCGCLFAEVIQSGAAAKHRASQTREYSAWLAAKARCYNKAHVGYANYGGRGIRMAEVWLNDFPRFLKDMGRCPKGFSLDRIDVNGDYAPGNCRWADKLTQSRNTRQNHYLTGKGKTLTFCEWADELNISRQWLWKLAIVRGMTIDQIVSQGFGTKRPKYRSQQWQTSKSLLNPRSGGKTANSPE